MYVKLFVLGRSGSGKSQTARHISNFLKPFDWTTRRFKDYDILGEMASNDERFRLLEQGGFDVLDASVLDEALQMLDARVQNYCDNIEKSQSILNELIIIEFARTDYNDAFKKLSQDIQQNAYFLFIDAELETCKQRIHDRMLSPESSDDHNISDMVMETYFREQYLPKDMTIRERLKVVENNGDWDDFIKELEPFIRKILHISDE